MNVDDLRRVGMAVDHEHRGHSAEEIAESSEHAEPNRLVVRVPHLRVGVGQQRMGKIVPVLSLGDALDVLGNDGDDLRAVARRAHDRWASGSGSEFTTGSSRRSYNPSVPTMTEAPATAGRRGVLGPTCNETTLRNAISRRNGPSMTAR